MSQLNALLIYTSYMFLSSVPGVRKFQQMFYAMTGEEMSMETSDQDDQRNIDPYITFSITSYYHSANVDSPKHSKTIRISEWPKKLKAMNIGCVDSRQPWSANFLVNSLEFQAEPFKPSGLEANQLPMPKVGSGAGPCQIVSQLLDWWPHRNHQM